MYAVDEGKSCVYEYTIVGYVYIYIYVSSLYHYNFLGDFNRLKNMKVSWDDYSQYIGQQKSCSKPPNSNYIHIPIFWIQIKH